MQARFRILLAFAALAHTSAQSDEALSASECVTVYTVADKNCDAIASFAQCIASTSTSDNFHKRATNLLVDAQTQMPHCDLAVRPSLRVVDREVSK